MSSEKKSRFHIPVTRHVLSNGLTVLLHEDHKLPQAAVNVWYHVGSKDEAKGKTGFAHLFEHMMFQGSEHCPEDYFKPLEEIGGRLNGSTSEDRTNYWEVVPRAYLERVLWLESDRMGWLLPALTQAKLDNQREVVKNERRETLENQPYGMAEEALLAALYPEGHPYQHSIIGSMEDLDAATLQDVQDFFRRYYTPNNATLCVAGDIDPEETLQLVRKHFGAIPPGPIVSPVEPDVPVLTKPVRVGLQDRVQLPRIYLQWPSPPQLTQEDTTLSVLAYVLTTGKDSRLVRRLQVEDHAAQSVTAYQGSGEVCSVFTVVLTAQPGRNLGEIEAAVWEEIRRVREAGVEASEVKAAVDSLKTGLIRRLQVVGGFGSISDILNYYQTFTGDPDGLERDLARYEAVTPGMVRDAVARFLPEDRYTCVEVLPKAESQAAGDRSAMPGEAAAAAFTFPEVHREALANGLRVWVQPQRGLPLVTVAAVLRAGSTLDPQDKPGLALFTAALADESAAGQGPLELARRWKSLATSLSTSVDWDGATFSLSMLTEHFREGLGLLADVLLRPDFTPEDLERVRKDHLAGLVRKLDEPSEVGDRALKSRLYGETSPYGHPYDGTPESLAAFRREDVLRFYKTCYRPEESLLIVVGDVSPGEALVAAEEAFGSWAAPEGQRPAPEGEREARRGGLALVPKPGAPQSYLTAAAPAISRSDPRYPAFIVFNAVLGGQFTSRVNMNLREDKGYTYGARSFLEFRPGVMPWVFYTAVQSDKTVESISEAIKEFRQVLDNSPITEEEFVKARNNLVLRYPQSFETQAQLAQGLSSIWLHGLRHDFHEWIVASLNALTLEDVRRAATEAFHPEDLVWVVVGDEQLVRERLPQAGLGEPEVIP